MQKYRPIKAAGSTKIQARGGEERLQSNIWMELDPYGAGRWIRAIGFRPQSSLLVADPRVGAWQGLRKGPHGRSSSHQMQPRSFVVAAATITECAPATVISRRRTRGREDPSAEQEDGAKQDDGGEPLLVALVEGGSGDPERGGHG